MRGDSSRSLSAQINTIPIPILNVRNISCSETLPSLCITPKTGSSGHVHRFISTETPSGRMRRYVLRKPPPVMCARCLDASRIQQWTDLQETLVGLEKTSPIVSPSSSRVVSGL